MTAAPRPLATALELAERASDLAVSTALTVDDAAELSERRRRALGEAVAELASSAARSPEPGLAMRVYGEGCLALALAGTFDRAALERLRNLMAELHHLAHVEVVIDLSLLRTCEQGLARVLAQLRVQRLVAGARVELHSPPPALAVELGHTPAQEFDVVDDTQQLQPSYRRAR